MVLQLMAALLGALPQGAPAEASSATDLPHVFFFLIDTCRADSLGAYGYSRDTSPFLDRLGAEGVVFERCYAQAPWTKPSMASILTSRYPSNTGVYDMFDRLDEEATTFPEVLKAAGYFTAGFSANPLMGRMSSYSQGFRYFREAFQTIPLGDCITYASGSSLRLNESVRGWFERYAGKSFVTGGEPLFLYVHSVDPHEEYDPAPEYLERFADPARAAAHQEDRQRLLDDSKQRVAPADIHRTRQHFEAIDLAVEPFMDYAKSLYDADVLCNDESIESLFHFLEERGFLDDALVILTSDHGDEFMEHDGTSHGFSLYNELIHVPLIVWGPGRIPEGVRISQPVQSLDIFPTLTALLGLEAPAEVQGHSLVPLLRGEAAEPRPVYSEKRDRRDGIPALLPGGTAVAVIRYPWKYVRNFEQPLGRELPERELYQLEDDPGETRNRAAEHPERVTALDREIEGWLVRNLRAGHPDQAAPEDIEAGTLELLRKLGYIK